MVSSDDRRGGFDGSAAVTRSLLGYGVLAGVVYLVAGVTLALTRDGFELSRHALSLLMLGDHGWMQRLNLVLAGLMTIAAAVGFGRAMRGSNLATAARTLVGVYGLALLASAAAAPDPMDGFPPGSNGGEATLSGALHLAAGAIGFLSLAAATVVVGRWASRRDEPGPARVSRTLDVVLVLGFVGGAALATRPAGVALLWVAVVAGWTWLAYSSILLYRSVPHPDADRRLTGTV